MYQFSPRVPSLAAADDSWSMDELGGRSCYSPKKEWMDDAMKKRETTSTVGCDESNRRRGMDEDDDDE
jgi:hypothetical protein